MKLLTAFVILTSSVFTQAASSMSHNGADPCSSLASATELSSLCVPGTQATCELSTGTIYKISTDTGAVSEPLPPIIVPAGSAICITNAVLSSPVNIYAQSVWLEGGMLQIGSAADPIKAEKKVTITMTGVKSASHAPLPICALGGSPDKCSPIAKASSNTPNARDITVSSGGRLLMYGAKGLTPVVGPTGNFIHQVDHSNGLVDGKLIEKDEGGQAVSGDINQVPYFNNLSGSRSWTYLRYPAGPSYFNSEMQVQAPVDLSNYSDLQERESKTIASTQPKAADLPYLVALSNMVSSGEKTDWQTGDWISIATTTFSPHETEIVQICRVYSMANPDAALPQPLLAQYDDVIGPTALPNVTVLVLAGAPSYKSKCPSLKEATPLKHYHFGSAAPTPGFFKTNAPKGYPDAKKGQAYSLFDDESRNFGIDERAEVALLSRNITLTSTAGIPSSSPIKNLDDQYFGGHIAVMNHDAMQPHHGHSDPKHELAATPPDVKVEIVGVEIEKFGQPLVGRYPIHFHMLNANSTKADSNHILVQDTVVHHSFNKCYVVHDTMATEFYNNSCIRNIGQSFYLEDGHNVAGNNFIRNHVAGAMAAALNYDMSEKYVKDGNKRIGMAAYWDGDYMAQQDGFNYDPSKVPDASDSGANTGNFIDSFAPGGFWITTFGDQGKTRAQPNLFVNNSVAGCQLGGSAYWLVRQDIENIKNVPSKIEADLYPVFTGNRGHACYNGVMAGTNFATINTLAPPGAPPKPVSPSATIGNSAQAPAVIFDSMTMTQIENKAFWYRGVFVGVTNGRFSALKQGMTLLGGGGPEGNLLGFWGLVHNSSFAGVTNNNVGRYSDCEGYYEQVASGELTLTNKTALPISTYNEMAKCAPIDMSSVSVSPAPNGNNSSLFGAIVPNFNFQGYTFYDGPARMEDNRFVNFRADPTNWTIYDNATNTYSTSSKRHLVTKIDAHRMLNYSMAGQFADADFQWGADDYFGAEGDAAFSWLKGNKQSVPPTQYAKGNRWENVNFKHQVFTQISNLDSPLQDGDKQTVEIDRDTTLSGYTLCSTTNTANCSNKTANHYPISLNNLDVFQTPYTTDEPLSRGRNNVISTALMSPHKYATVNIGVADQKPLESLTVARDMPSIVGDTAQTTMSGRGGNKFIFEAMVMNNMGYTYKTPQYPKTTLELLFSYSDAPVDTNFINRVGICIGTGATGISIKKTTRQWNSGVNYLAQSTYWGDESKYGLKDSSSTCPSVVTQQNAFTTCELNANSIKPYAKKNDLNAQYFNVLKANYNLEKGTLNFIDGFYYDETSGILYFNMMQPAQKVVPASPVTPPYGSCDASNYQGANGTRETIANYLKYSNNNSIEGTLDVACYAQSGTPTTSDLLTCPFGGCSVYTVSADIKETNPTCTSPPWAVIGNGSKPKLDPDTSAVTYSAPYLLYNKTAEEKLATSKISVKINNNNHKTLLTRHSRYVSGGIDSTTPPAADALLPLAKPIYKMSSPPTTIIMANSEPDGVSILEFGKPATTKWTLATGTSSAAGQKATITPIAGGKLHKGASPYDAENSVSVIPTADKASATFYYSGTQADIEIGTEDPCQLTFQNSTVKGSCPGLTISGTTLTIGLPPAPKGVVWTLVTGASVAAGQNATLTPLGSGEFRKTTLPYSREASVSVEPNTESNSKPFYYSGKKANITIGKATKGCVLTFDVPPVKGACEGLATSGTTLTITAPKQ